MIVFNFTLLFIGAALVTYMIDQTLKAMMSAYVDGLEQLLKVIVPYESVSEFPKVESVRKAA